MSEPFIGEIKLVGFNFPPRGWALCDGQLLAIASNQALFSLLGTTFGGDGRTTFALPDLRGRSPVHVGTGPGLSPMAWGQEAGAETATLNISQIPAHRHPVRCNNGGPNVVSPEGNYLAQGEIYHDASNALMHGDITETVGGGQSHENRSPYLAVNFAIALVGLYPSRN